MHCVQINVNINGTKTFFFGTGSYHFEILLSLQYLASIDRAKTVRSNTMLVDDLKNSCV